MPRIFWLCLLSILACLPAQAATFTWGNVTGNWSTGTNWNPAGAPTGNDPADVLVFGGDVGTVAGVAPNYTSSNDVAAIPFRLNALTLQATDPLNQLNPPAHALDGNQIALTTGGSVTQNGAGPITLNLPVQLGAALTLAGNGAGSVTFNRGLSGLGDITKTGTSTYRFGTFPIFPAVIAPSENTWHGMLTISGGTVRYNNNAESGRTALRANPVTLSLGTTLTCASQLRLGTLAGAGGLVETQVTGSNANNDDLVVTTLHDGSFAGTVRIGPPTGTGNDGGTWIVRGPGTQTVSGTLAIEKDVTIGGALTFAGTASLGAQLKGSVNLAGGTFRLDNTGTNNNDRLRNASSTSTGLDVAGGGLFLLDGHTGGTSETVGRLQLAAQTGSGSPRTRARSGELRLLLRHRAASAATSLTIQGYERDAISVHPLDTVEFAATDGAGVRLELGTAGNTPKVFINPLPIALSDGLFANTTGSASTGWAVLQTSTGLAFASHDVEGVLPVPVSTTFASSTTTNLEVSATQSVSSTFSAKSLRLLPGNAGLQILINTGGVLNSTGFILTGAHDFAIAGPGAISGSGPRYFHIDEARTLTVSVGLGTAQSLVKSGAGTLVLTNTGNAANQQPYAINRGTLRAATNTLPGGELRFRGGVLEVTGGGNFQRPLLDGTGISGPGTVSWSGSEIDGGVPVNVVNDRGSGGFAAIGGNLTVDLGPAGVGDVRWEDRGFLQSGYALVFGSANATGSVTLLDHLNLTSTEATVTYNAREIRVDDNPGSTTDRGVLSGILGGTIHNDLLKTGNGTLELSNANNTLAGAAIIHAGTLHVSGSLASSIVSVVRNGATLAGGGTVSQVLLENGGSLAPGNAGIGTLTGAALTWRAGGIARFDLAATSDQLDLGSGPLVKGSASGAFVFDFGNSGQFGKTYVLAKFGSTTFAAGDFTAQNLGAGLSGNFQIVSGELRYITGNAPPPAVVTGSASDLTPITATLNGTVNPQGDIATAVFEYGLTTGYGSTAPVSPDPSGSGVLPVSAAISGLTPNTLYHFRLVATTTGGTVMGSDQTFTTAMAPPPTVVTGNASNVTTSSAIVQGTVNPNGFATTAVIEYGPTTAYGSTMNVPAPGSGTAPVSVAETLSGLMPGTLYHYRLTATNVGGTASGNDATFTTTGAVPTVATGNATNITDQSATLNGTVNPNQLATTALFEIGTTTSYGTQIPVSPDPGSGTNAVNVSVSATGLAPNTLYHFRLVATNQLGTTPGADMTFTTTAIPQPPVPGDDVLFTAGKSVTYDVLLNDVNPATGNATGLVFDGLVGAPTHGIVNGGPTITYTPNKSFPTTGDTFTYRVKKTADNQTAIGTVTILPFAAKAKSYGGVIDSAAPQTTTDTGSFTGKLTAKGAASGKLLWQGQSYAFKGKAGVDGKFTATKPKLPKGSVGTVTATLQLGAAETATVTVLDSTAGSPFTGTLFPAGVVSPGDLITKGTFTAFLDPDQTPPGFGYVTATVDKKRTAKFSGRTEDGEPFSDASVLYGNRWLLDPLLYKLKKGFGGQLRAMIDVTGGNTLAATTDWTKAPSTAVFDPAGFFRRPDLNGTRFTDPVLAPNAVIFNLLGNTNGDATLTFADGNLAAPATATLKFTTTGVAVTGTTLQKFKFKLNAKAGTFSGEFTHPASGKKTTYAGAFERTAGEGRGSFRGATAPGSARLEGN